MHPLCLCVLNCFCTPVCSLLSAFVSMCVCVLMDRMRECRFGGLSAGCLSAECRCVLIPFLSLCLHPLFPFSRLPVLAPSSIAYFFIPFPSHSHFHTFRSPDWKASVSHLTPISCALPPLSLISHWKTTTTANALIENGMNFPRDFVPRSPSPVFVQERRLLLRAQRLLTRWEVE